MHFTIELAGFEFNDLPQLARWDWGISDIILEGLQSLMLDFANEQKIVILKNALRIFDFTPIEKFYNVSP